MYINSIRRWYWKSWLVETMHEVYRQLEKNREGEFIAGPYKTADIEQDLVLGLMDL